ncbi:aminotransferase-like domain-containing protein [Rhodotorula paludigena]|uniref:aminotransferase-like domain-containing protein n=1 Tax=Rhodotorula paludigena TaxID=86838 RepID=UPI00316F65BB
MDDSYALAATLSRSAGAADKPNAADLSHHLSDLAKARITSPLKAMYKYMQRPGMLMLAGGLPPPEYFPFESISAQTLARNSYKTTQIGFGAWLWSWISGGAKATDSWSIPKRDSDPSRIQLASALQYGTAAGLAPLAQFIHAFTERVYQPGYADFHTVINAGSTDAWGKIVGTLCNPGDGVLCEEWTYPSALATAWPADIKPVPLPMDGQGMTAEGMDQLLGSWNPDEHDGMSRPRVLYTIPVCQNPTGATMSLERKKAIYALAVKYDVIIVEDDPYYFLQAGEYEPSPPARAASLPKKTETDDEFIASLVPSYLKIDYEGRVVRIDTFSKTICPGSRLGWTTTNPVFAERIERANESSTQSASGFAQALVGKLLAEEWKLEGYLRWLKGIKAQYRDRRNLMVDALLDLSHASLDARQAGSGFEYWTQDAHDRDEKGFVARVNGGMSEKGGEGAGRRILSFVSPQGGMFVWLRVHFATHPRFHSKPTNELLAELWEDFAEHNVLIAPGTMFSARDFPQQPPKEEGAFAVAEEGDAFFRIAFSTATAEQIHEAAKIIAQRVEHFFRA